MKTLFVFILLLPSFLLGQFSLEDPLALPAANAEQASKPNVTVHLLSDHSTVVPGSSFYLGVELRHQPQWHTYWKVPGDSGLATSLEWTLPEGVQTGEIQWPVPKRYDDEGIVSYVHEGTTVLKVPVTLSEQVPTGELSISLNARWLECKTMCLPGGGSASLTLNVGTEAAASSTPLQHTYPTGNSGWTFRHQQEGNTVHLDLMPPQGQTTLPVAFYPLNEYLWDLATPFEITQTDSGVRITGRLQDDVSLPAQLSGVVELPGSSFFLEPATAATPETPALQSDGNSSVSLGGVLLLAFAGGLLLNLMPCVFPVLGLKISGFVHQAQGDQAKARKHGYVFALGILLSMWVLAAFVSALNLAWGQQFQSVEMNIGISILFFALALNLFGVFEIGTRMTTVGGNLQAKDGYAGSFYSGLLVTIAATPCTAPMLGAALGWAVGQPTAAVYLLFTMLSIGMALPYVILSSSPKLMNKVPAPGAWMETFKQSMGFLLLGFVLVWIWVLAGQVATPHLLKILSSLVLVSLAGWIYGKWCAPHRSTFSRGVGGLLTLALAVGALNTALRHETPAQTINDELQARIDAGDPVQFDKLSPDLARDLIADGVPVHWQPWSKDAVQELRNNGKAVFVDFTARWCLTCQVNKKTTLRKQEVMKAFSEAGVETRMADWTNEDETILEAIRGLGRNGVPVYALYPADPSGDVILLPETLTPQIIKDSLEKL